MVATGIVSAQASVCGSCENEEKRGGGANGAERCAKQAEQGRKTGSRRDPRNFGCCFVPRDYCWIIVNSSSSLGFGGLGFGGFIRVFRCPGFALAV